MGGQQSPAAPANALLERLVSVEPIPKSDSFWHELFSFSLPLPQAGEDVAAVSFAYCADMGRNNAQSFNFQTLVLQMVEKLERARTKPSEALMLQCSGSVFLMRTFLKHMLETYEPEARLRTAHALRQCVPGAPACLPLPPRTCCLTSACPRRRRRTSPRLSSTRCSRR